MPLLLIALLFASDPELPVREIQVSGNQRTHSESILRIARLHVGKRVRTDQVEEIRERLMTSGLFSDALVTFDERAGGLAVSIWVSERQSWFIIPSAAFFTGNAGGGLAVGETNMRGKDERLLIYGAVYTTDSRLSVAYQDPALWDSYFYGRVDAGGARSRIDEFNPDLANSANFDSPDLLRKDYLWSAGGGLQFGRLLPAHLHVDLYYHAALERYERSGGMFGPAGPPSPDGFLAYAHVGFGYDNMMDVWGVRHGTTGGVWVEGSHPAIGSDFRFGKVGASLTRGFRFFTLHNLIVTAAAGAGVDLPFDFEFEGGGPSLRGYPYRQFRGDTVGEAHAEYVAPLVKLWKIDFRGALFYDTMAIWFRDLSGAVLQPDGTYRVAQPEGNFRDFLPSIDMFGHAQPPPSGLDRDHWHNDIGAGVRVYLRNVNLPLFGLDVGYGLENQSFQVLVAAGVAPVQ